MKKGIVIFAIGHPNYYYMAENLAASLLSNGIKQAGISVCLICDNRRKIRYPDLFTDILLLKNEDFMVDEKIVFNNVTVKIYDLSPYDITMKLDADLIWLGGRPVDKLFNRLKDVDFTFSNFGHGWNKQLSPWTPEYELKSKYQFTDDHKLYRVFGEFIYFKKTSVTKKYFDKLKSVYENPKVTCQEFANGNMTDELAYQITCMQTEIYPHEDNYTPIFNSFLKIRELDTVYPYQLPDSYFAWSIGGNVTNKRTKDGYDTLAKHYFRINDLQGPYLASNKKSFLPEREKI